jgi:hypothetical protein
MAFRFNWPQFDAEFYDEAKSQLEVALNKGNKPKNIVDHITVKELDMGTLVMFNNEQESYDLRIRQADFLRYLSAART